MKKKGKKVVGIGCVFGVLFAVWTALIQTVDVQPLGQNGTNIGFAAFNCWFHEFTGVSMTTYTITDWLGLVPLFVCMGFGFFGLIQLVSRRSLLKVDTDIFILGGYYICVIAVYIIFEMIPINYRPILIGGAMEASYPSSTTLLVLSVMPTLVEQFNRRVKNRMMNRAILVITILFSGYMVIGRLLSGVHWFTDILGSVLLSVALFAFYKGFVLLCSKDAVRHKQDSGEAVARS